MSCYDASDVAGKICTRVIDVVIRVRKLVFDKNEVKIMAGCQWSKFKGATECKAVLRHNDKEERKKYTHSNEQLDVSKTDMNVDLIRDLVPEYNYKAKCMIYDRKIKELEENAIRLRADRVTMFGIEVPIPNEISDADVKRFVELTYGAVADVVGSENIIAVDEHSDEVHTYLDPDKNEERTSRRHIHVSCVPGVDGRLNGKQFSTRERMVKLNNEMQDICEQEFGCKFMTGEKTKSKDNVENLKFKSRKAEAEKKEKEAKDLNAEVTMRENAVKQREKSIEKREADLLQKEINFTSKKQELDGKEKDVLSREQHVQTREQNVMPMEDLLRIHLDMQKYIKKQEEEISKNRAYFEKNAPEVIKNSKAIQELNLKAKKLISEEGFEDDLHM